MYYLIGRAFQNQSVFLRAFPGTIGCRGVTAAVLNNNVGGFIVSTNNPNQPFSRWALKPYEDKEAKLKRLIQNSGVVNTAVSKRNSSSGDHVALWTAEKAFSAVLIPLLPITFLMPSAPLEYLTAFVLTLHSHWGIEAIVVDYVRPSIFGETIPKLAVTAVYGLSALTLGGLFYFIYSDVGIVQALKMLWNWKSC